MQEITDQIFDLFKTKTKKPFDKELFFSEDAPDNLLDLLNWVWKQNWPIARKMYYVSVISYLQGVSDFEKSLHPAVIDVMLFIQSLDDQGIDIEQLSVTAIPKMTNHRPEQMAKWPIIAWN